MISIVLAEDQTMLREAMVQLINLNDNIEVVASTGNGKQALAYIESEKPNVAILDIEMPGLTGLEILSHIRNKQLDVKVIIVTTFKRPGYFESAVSNDVDAYVLKERSIEELVTTVYKVLNDEKEYSESLMTTIFNERNPLTPKEQLVLKEIGKGHSSKEIAINLFLSDGTIRNYTSIIIDKLEAENRYDAWHIAKHKGWI
ncbi:response regulator [Staphylococcus shinii]|uniref:response regulator transcription factor n=2 Tax=Staphylococcus TaxID=1279 RepID=UPI00057C2ECB|nr:response regulator transcription factor [Staphylococcus shinii]MBO3064362.1 response regulator transcription factor [Staphylococcus shinii]MDW8570918.1 response regulator transcription factor [Staphylococcus shinii]MDW8573181.1 response regulator transcription factor [Staphylococcus shinii]OEK83445.1 two-component system response regulator [Staphylococcus shinii]PKI09168.1 DNA-binding response regulator [Staphylococcus shinii]